MGGVAEDEDETRDRVSKVCRAVLTRLHAEISRSINFYRSQQGGGMPKKLYITGGTSLLPQIGEFFGDSLQIEVEFLNPFAALGTGGSVSAEALETDCPFLTATAGLAVAMSGSQALSVNLLPPSIVSERVEKARIPFVAAAALAFVAAMVCSLLAIWRGNEVVDACKESVESRASQLDAVKRRADAAMRAAEEAEADATALRNLALSRNSAVARFNAVRQALGDDMWIERWEGARVTVRGWKDSVEKFAASAAAKDSSMKNRTAPEVVVARLKNSPVVESATVVDMSAEGREGCIVQFVVEIVFK